MENTSVGVFPVRDDPVEELLPQSDTVFGFTHMDATLEFVKNASGKVEKFVFRQGGMSREAKKIR